MAQVGFRLEEGGETILEYRIWWCSLWKVAVWIYTICDSVVERMHGSCFFPLGLFRYVAGRVAVAWVGDLCEVGWDICVFVDIKMENREGWKGGIHMKVESCMWGARSGKKRASTW